MKRALTIVTIFSFISIAVFGLGYLNEMKFNEDGEMSGCIFTGKTVFCKMGIIEHISLWQGMFKAVPQENLVLFVLLAFLATAVFAIKNIFVYPRLFGNDISTKQILLIKRRNLSLSHSLKEAFSQGIINPKIYEFASL